MCWEKLERSIEKHTEAVSELWNQEAARTDIATNTAADTQKKVITPKEVDAHCCRDYPMMASFRKTRTPDITTSLTTVISPNRNIQQPFKSKSYIDRVKQSSIKSAQHKNPTIQCSKDAFVQVIQWEDSSSSTISQ